MLSHVFTACSAHRLTALVDPANTSSWKLLESLSMRREGHLLQNVYFEIRPGGVPCWNDTYKYGILASAWKYTSSSMDTYSHYRLIEVALQNKLGTCNASLRNVRRVND